MRFALPLLPLILSLAACAPPSPIARLPQEAVVVAFGDSLTSGVGAQIGYPQRLQTLIGREVINAGIPGETSAEALRRFPAVLRRHRPALVVICTGGNDFLRRQSAAKTESNLREIVALAEAAGVEVALLAVPRLSLFALNHPLYAKIADDYDLWIEDEILKSVLHDDDLKSDRIHPNDDGYRQIAEAVAALLRRAEAV